MGIVFRHDAAGVVPPSNSATRKYGQQLVLQQNQQKYAAQQAGYDRMLQLGRDAQQNQFQLGRDNAQQAFIQGRDKAQNAFQTERDKFLAEQQLQQMQAAQQRKFMDDARKQSSGMIMQDIQDGAYDPATARKLQQNLVAESEALGNPQLDATQRAEALEKLRAERALLSANRMERPTPTRDEQLRTFLGDGYDQYGTLPWVPDGKGGFSVSKEALGQHQKEQEQQQKMRPKSFQDYYQENEDKFQKDLDATMQSMQTTDPETGAVSTVTPDEALAKMQKDYDFRQKALGRSQYGDPTAAPALPGATPAVPGQSRSILEQQPIRPDSKLAEQARALGMDLNAPPPVPTPAPQAPPAEPTPVDRTIEALQSAMKRELTPQEIESVKSWTHPPETAGAPTNPWSEVASDSTQTAPAAPAAPPASKAGSKPPATDFGALASSAKNDADRAFISKMQEVHQGQSPDVQAAIGVLLSPNTSDRDAANALMYLKSKGIDVEQLMAAPKSDDMVYPATGLM